MSLKAVFFDLDGTLLDTAQDLGRALNDLLIEEKRDPIPINELRHVVSDGALGLLKLGFNIDDKHETYQSRRAKLLHYYLQDLSSNTIPFVGITELIKKLNKKNIAWGIATNKPWTYTEPLMTDFSFTSDPICVICPEHVTKKKPHPESLFQACKLANCKTHECIYIGDHIRDIECGNRAGAITIAAGYGYIKPKNKYLEWPADHFASSAEELWPIIEKHIIN